MASWPHRNTVLAVTTTAFFCTMFARVILSPLLPRIIQEFDISRAVVGLALTGMWAVFALMQFPAGVLSERFGERRIVLAALGFTAAGSLSVALAPTFPLFAVLVVVIGVGAGLFMPAAGSLLTRLFPGTGRALGINSMGAPLGGLVGPPVAAVLAARYGWRAAPLAAAALATTVLLIGAWRVRPVTPERPGAPMRDRFNPGTVVALFVRPPILYTTLLSAVGFFAYQAITSFFPTFLVQHAGYSDATAAILFGLVFGLAIGGAPLLGWLSDRLGRDVVLGGGFLAGGVGIALFLVSSSPAAVAVGTPLIAVGMSWPGVMNSRFMDLFTDDERGASFGLVRTGFLLVSSLGSVVTGSLADTLGWVPAFGFIAALFGVGVLMILGNRVLDAGL